MTRRWQKLPEKYRVLDEGSLIKSIVGLKKHYGKKLLLLAHHYQRKEIVRFADYIGDSYDLAKRAAQNGEAEFIVFCGVRFMAESAAILAQPGQTVIHPDVDAGCPLADMADIVQVESVWQQFKTVTNTKKIMPVVYINSDSELKAFCGKHGGTVCTSSKAVDALNWAFAERDKVLFFPDANLGENSAVKLQLPRQKVFRLNSTLPFDRQSEERIKEAKLLLWNGHCHVHTWFKTEHIQKIRKNYPDVKIVVHPECRREIVDLADASGSTKFIVNFVDDSPKNSIIAIGTEANLVDRLARENPDKKILPLSKSICPNMWKVSLNDLFWVLENLGEVNKVVVEEKIKKDARIALQNMLQFV